MSLSTDTAKLAEDACPCCGGEAEWIKSDDKVHPYRGVCKSCGLQTAHHGNFQAAFKAWTARTYTTRLTELEAERDRLKGALAKANQGFEEYERKFYLAQAQAEAAEEAGRQKERAEIVAWLREQNGDFLFWVTTYIERGDYIPTGEEQ